MRGRGRSKDARGHARKRGADSLSEPSNLHQLICSDFGTHFSFCTGGKAKKLKPLAGPPKSSSRTSQPADTESASENRSESEQELQPPPSQPESVIPEGAGIDEEDIFAQDSDASDPLPYFDIRKCFKMLATQQEQLTTSMSKLTNQLTNFETTTRSCLNQLWTKIGNGSDASSSMHNTNPTSPQSSRSSTQPCTPSAFMPQNTRVPPSQEKTDDAVIMTVYQELKAPNSNAKLKVGVSQFIFVTFSYFFLFSIFEFCICRSTCWIWSRKLCSFMDATWSNFQMARHQR